MQREKRTSDIPDIFDFEGGLEPSSWRQEGAMYVRRECAIPLALLELSVDSFFFFLGGGLSTFGLF